MTRLKLHRVLGLALIWVGLASFAGAAAPDKSAVTHPYPEGDKGDLWVLAGQSNMVGYATLKAEVQPDPRIQFFANDDKWIVAREPLEKLYFPHGDPHGMVPDYTKLPVGGGGLGMFFAQHLVKYTGRPLGLIGVATGKDMTRIWNPDLMGKNMPRPYIYEPLVKRIIQAGGWGKLKGVVYYQGESDAVEYPSAAKVYEDSLTKFIDRLRADTGNPDLPFIIVQINRLVTNTPPGFPGKSGGGEQMTDEVGTYTQAWEHVREVQRQMADKRKNVFVISSLDLGDMVDPIHLEYESFQKLGPRIAEVALSQIYKLKGHATPIKLESIKTEPLLVWHSDKAIQGRAQVRVRFSGVNGRLRSGDRPTGFVLRFLKEGISAWPPYQTEFDPQDPNAVLLRFTTIPDNLQPVLYYGKGLNPYCNIVDSKGMPIPVFGPVPVPPLPASDGTKKP